MTKRKVPTDGLLAAMDAAAEELLKSVNLTTIAADAPDTAAQPVDVKGRVAAFEAVTNYLAVKHKIQPTGASRNGIDRYRTAINGGTPQHRAGGAHAEASSGPNGADTDD